MSLSIEGVPIPKEIEDKGTEAVVEYVASVKRAQKPVRQPKTPKEESN